MFPTLVQTLKNFLLNFFSGLPNEGLILPLCPVPFIPFDTTGFVDAEFFIFMYYDNN